MANSQFINNIEITINFIVMPTPEMQHKKILNRRNRLIIVGNGFDLAHKIETSFKNFITSYVTNCVKEFLKKSYFKDDLIEIGKPNPTYKIHYSGEITSDDINQVIDRIFSAKREPGHEYKVSSFLRHIYVNAINKGWVDIEYEYFSFLKKAKNVSSSNVIALNKDFDLIKSKLIEYLKEKEGEFTNSFDIQPLVDSFCEDIYGEENGSDQIPGELFFLNFNYTNTLEPYVRVCNSSIPSTITYIHGSLELDKHGEPIFGYGDELDSEYSLFEELNENELYKHIKSFEYVSQNNYQNLLGFLESGPFEVYVFGHSCGVSDRTMLNEIFEHQDCRYIKIFYHKKLDGSTDFKEKTYNIYRHFKDKGTFRKRLIPKGKPMPQPKYAD